MPLNKMLVESIARGRKRNRDQESAGGQGDRHSVLRALWPGAWGCSREQHRNPETPAAHPRNPETF